MHVLQVSLQTALSAYCDELALLLLIWMPVAILFWSRVPCSTLDLKTRIHNMILTMCYHASVNTKQPRLL